MNRTPPQKTPEAVTIHIDEVKEEPCLYTADQTGSPSLRPKGPAKATRYATLYSQANSSASSLNGVLKTHSRNGSSASAHYMPITASASPPPKPFSFGSGSLDGSAPLPKPSRRKGHHYKHSSVSMNMFQTSEKEPATSSSLPNYPVPAFKEIVASISSVQSLRLLWCIFQLSVAAACYVIGFKFGNVCLSTLSHVVLYDAFGNLLQVAVQVLTNFDVWRNASIRYPFGLGRIEVLVAFGLSVSLVFVGFDLLSHMAEDFMIDFIGADHDEHAHHVHESKGAQLSPVLYELFLGVIVVVSMLSSFVINKKVEEPDPDSPKKSLTKRLSSVTLESPKKQSFWSRFNLAHNGINGCTTVLTVVYSFYSMVYPLIHASSMAELLNQASTVALSMLILGFGWKLVVTMGNILLLKGSPARLERSIIKSIRQLDLYRSSYRIDEFIVSRVNHKTSIVILRMEMPGVSDDDESKFRFYTTHIIRSLLYKADSGQLDKDDENPDRKSLASLMNINFDSLDESGDQFEITIDIDRM